MLLRIIQDRNAVYLLLHEHVAYITFLIVVNKDVFSGPLQVHVQGANEHNLGTVLGTIVNNKFASRGS